MQVAAAIAARNFERTNDFGIGGERKPFVRNQILYYIICNGNATSIVFRVDSVSYRRSS